MTYTIIIILAAVLLGVYIATRNLTGKLHSGLCLLVIIWGAASALITAFSDELVMDSHFSERLISTILYYMAFCGFVFGFISQKYFIQPLSSVLAGVLGSAVFFSGNFLLYFVILGLYGFSGTVQQAFYSNILLLTQIIGVITVMLFFLHSELDVERSGNKILLRYLWTLEIPLFLAFVVMGISQFYSGYVVKQSEKSGIVQQKMDFTVADAIQEYNQKIARFYQANPDYELPYETSYLWLGNSNQKITEQKRAATWKLFDSPQELALLEDYQKILKLYDQIEATRSGIPVLYAAKLNVIRSYVRKTLGRTALFMEQGKSAEALNELRKYVQIELNYFHDSRWVMQELVLNGCRNAWFAVLVSLGPDGKEFVPFYREMLDFMKTRKVRIPLEAGYYLYKCKNYKVTSFWSFMRMPTEKISAARALSVLTDFQITAERLEKSEVIPAEVYALKKHIDFGRVAGKGRLSIVMGTTALALKTYRSEHGKYPGSLQELIPAYLEKIPVEPEKGIALIYVSDGRNFTLKDKKENYSVAVSSVKYY